MRIVVALGGNALLKRGEPMTHDVQRANIQVAARALAPVARQHQIVLAHGNGPQVGLLALQASAYKDVEAYPLDVLGAQTEGMIGYMIEQELGNLLPFEAPFATILTMVEVDPSDPAFRNPTKFVGPVYEQDEASELLAREVEADLLVIATDVKGVYLDWGKPEQRRLGRVTIQDLRAHPFPAGSMGPKVEAAVRFVERTGKRATIGALKDIAAIVDGTAGTNVVAGG